MTNTTLKIITIHKNAVVNYYLNNKDDMYPPTHILPYIDPPSNVAHNEFKVWEGDNLELYKLHFESPYIIGQLEMQSDVHFNEPNNKFYDLLDKDIDITYLHNSDDIKNIDNILKEANENYDEVLVIVHRLHAYILPYHLWKSVQRHKNVICIDNSFEAEHYSFHRLFYWLHVMFEDCSFVKYLCSSHDTPRNHLLGIISRKDLIKQEFGIDIVNVEFFMLHELGNNKHRSCYEEGNKLTYINYEPELFYDQKRKKYKYLCLNNYMKDHRLFVINKLVQNNLIDKGIVSARFSLDPEKNFFNHGIHNFQTISDVNNIFSNFGHSITPNEFEKLKGVLPLIVDDDYEANKVAVNPDMFGSDLDESQDFEFRDRWVNWKWYAESLFSIVNESSFRPDLISQIGIFRQYNIGHSGQSYYGEKNPPDVGFLTEKTFKPIMYGHPFILVTHAGALAHLKDLGFETFPEWFDESYDNMSDCASRMNHVCESIIKACNKDLNINDVKDKCEYNRHHYFSVSNSLIIFNKLFEDLMTTDK